MIQITNHIAISEKEIQFSAVRASGPGGQNVNRVKTAVQLRFPVPGSASLPEPVKQNLLKKFANMINHQGELIIEARRFRTQQRNRKDAEEKLVRIIRKAAVKPKRRKKTRPGKKAVERRLREKQKRGEKKQLRKPIS